MEFTLRINKNHISFFINNNLIDKFLKKCYIIIIISKEELL